MRNSLTVILTVAFVLAVESCDLKRARTASADDLVESADPAPRGPQELAVVGFYNVENLFDTDDDSTNAGDDEFLPTSAKGWTPDKYLEKLGHTADAISDIGSEAAAGGPAMLGLAEVENERVLRDLIAQPALARSGYEAIHYDSPDYRGIDVAFLYRPEYFEPVFSLPLRVALGTSDDGSERTTRDVLYVKGLLLGDTLHYFVNHWPSRGGGEVASRPGRVAAASVVRAAVDSIRGRSPRADIIIVGDLNDDPIDASVTATLRAADRRGKAAGSGLYNPTVALFRRGEGTLGYRGAWNLFDQIIVSQGLAEYSSDWTLREVRILRKAYLLQSTGRSAGFPFRTFVGEEYIGGYSDHLPSYGILTRPKA